VDFGDQGDFLKCDKLTGLAGPSTRAPRKKKEKSSSSSATTSNKPSRKKKATQAKGKGKEKEVSLPSSPERDLRMDEGGIGDDSLEDIYVD